MSNGGYLDEVVFMVNTKQMHHVRWLDELIREEPLYAKVATNELIGHFDNIWNQYATDDDTMYIKIDDDIVRPFFHHVGRP